MCKCTPTGHEVHPPYQSKSQFLGFFAGWLRFGGIFKADDRRPIFMTDDRFYRTTFLVNKADAFRYIQA